MIDFEAEYNNRARVPDHLTIIEKYQSDAAAYRDSADCQIDQAYGLGANLKFDLFGTSLIDTNKPMALFIHGGYWQSMSPKFFSHMARGINGHGIPVAVAGYDLCPEVHIEDIVEDLRQLCAHIWTNYRRPIIAYGHSAGGHLTGAILTTDWPARGMPVGLVSAGLAISGLFDLVPLVETTINDKLGMDQNQALRMSPIGMPTPYGTRFVATVGGDESEEYHRQSRVIVDTWSRAGVSALMRGEPGANHFTIVEPLADPDSALTGVLAALAMNAP